MPEDSSVSSWRGRHFDGRSAESRPVEVRLDPGGLRVDAGDGLPALWPFEELVLMRGDRRGEPVQLERRSSPVEVVVVDAETFFPALRAAWPAPGRLRSPGAPALRILLGIALAGLVLLFALWRFGIPWLADVAAERMPGEWEAQYGAAMLEEFQRTHPPVQDPDVRRPASLVEASLVPVTGPEPRRERFVVLDQDLPNAFALPGGHIVLTTGLLSALESPDELAAVFAHEWGHVRQRHVLRSVFRQASLQVLLAFVAGDQSALSGTLRMAGELGSLSYSRGWEREADDEAMALLAAHGTSPAALVAALESIRKAARTEGAAIGFLSTHPTSAERAERIRENAKRLHVTGAAGWRDIRAWHAMKARLEAGRLKH